MKYLDDFFSFLEILHFFFLNFTSSIESDTVLVTDEERASNSESEDSDGNMDDNENQADISDPPPVSGKYSVAY